MKIKATAAGIAIAGTLALGTAMVIEPSPARAESVAGDVEVATNSYRVGVTGMT